MMADGPRLADNDPCAGHANDPQNIALATATHAALVVRSRMFDRGIKRARFVVIRDIRIPGVLIEGGFLSNPYDARLIATPAYRQQMASSILQAVQNYRRAVGSQIGEVVAKHVDGPRVETNSPMLRGNSSAIEVQPLVVTPTAPAAN
jgi:N-acetylmuramoyl-L-alanine amidase